MSESARGASRLVWRKSSAGEIVRRDLPYLRGEPLARWLCRGLALAFQHQILAIRGLEQILPERDPFILVLNHNVKLEALSIPGMMVHLRGGKRIHFLFDWNFALIPGVALVLRRAECVVIVQKPARPRFLNVFKPLFRHPIPAYGRLRRHLEAGRSIGIFPEGTRNPDPHAMLAGHPGAARLSLQTGVPVVPAGIRFPYHDPDRPIGMFARTEVEIGQAMEPPRPARRGRPTAEEVRTWHAAIMSEIGRLSGKAWPPPARDTAAP